MPRAAVLLCYTWAAAANHPPPRAPFLLASHHLAHFAVLKFSRRSGRRRLPLPLIRFSPDNLGESACCVSALLRIIASATSTTGFICWRRATFDTLASQAGLPLSPAQALFPASRGGSGRRTQRGAFNEILTLPLRAVADI